MSSHGNGNSNERIAVGPARAASRPARRRSTISWGNAPLLHTRHTGEDRMCRALSPRADARTLLARGERAGPSITSMMLGSIRFSTITSGAISPLITTTAERRRPRRGVRRFSASRSGSCSRTAVS